MSLPVVLQNRGVEVTIKSSKKVLGGDTMSSFIEKNGDKLVWAGPKEGIEETHLQAISMD